MTIQLRHIICFLAGVAEAQINLAIAQERVPLKRGAELGTTDFHSRFGILRHFLSLRLRQQNDTRGDLFGGLTSLTVSSDGTQLLALDKKGYFTKFRAQHGDDGSTLKIGEVALYEMKAANGSSLVDNSTATTKSFGGLAAAGDGHYADGARLYVGGIRSGELVGFPNGVTSSRSEVVDLGRDVGRCPGSTGPGPLQYKDLDEGILLVLCGRPEGGHGTIPIWSYNMVKKQAAEFSVEPVDSFDVVDITELPSGDLLLLMRRRGGDNGLAVKIAYVRWSELSKAISSEGSVPYEMLATIREQDGYDVENMEGIAARQDRESRRVLIYLLSNNNFEKTRATVLWAFEWLPDSDAIAGDAGSSKSWWFSIFTLVMVVLGAIIIVVMMITCCRQAHLSPPLQRLRALSGQRILGRRSAAATYYRGEFSSSDDDDDEFELGVLPGSTRIE
ncbi:hypothetical protein FOZ63_002877 [Perkinsus olseni]|uniref:Phytase-like domain-containing protein n=2 Tax=Perkinsus olseni TaxID=32597 RepID=A0A7J6RN68_PEROL|nr:hypothetical protein FOZ63_002877 [Perkinsus olseni]